MRTVSAAWCAQRTLRRHVGDPQGHTQVAGALRDRRLIYRPQLIPLNAQKLTGGGAWG